MKKIIFILSLIASLNAGAQKNDNTKPCKTDTVVLWVKYNVQDTAAAIIAYYDKRSIKTVPGYVIAHSDYSNTWQGAKNQWVQYLDYEFNPLKKSVFSWQPAKKNEPLKVSQPKP